jgi:hypothetical protein
VEREPVDKMIGDALREAGILVFVFAILDKVIAGSITVTWTAVALAAAVVLFGMGMYMERRRKDG